MAFRNFLHKLVGDRGASDRGSEAHVTQAPAQVPAPVVNVASALSLESIVRVQEVDNARYFVNALFRRRFRADAPEGPRHFIAFHRATPFEFAALGYVHYLAFEDSWLCGGMVMDERAYRRLPSAQRATIRQAGGVAEIMLRATFAQLRAAPAIWGYVGDRQAEAVDLRAGFEHTGVKHVMVCWNRPLPAAEKSARLARVAALGPF
jgi:hypothetical protein